MKKNVGELDKNIRILLGFVFGFLGFFVSPWFFLVAFALFMTAFVNFCGLYTLIGVNTCEVKNH